MKQPKVSYARETDGRWIAEVASMPGVMKYGATKSEARTAVLQLVKEVRAADRSENVSGAYDPGRVVTPLPFYEASTVVGLVAHAFGLQLLGEPRADGSRVALRTREQVAAQQASERFLARYKASVLAEEERGRLNVADLLAKMADELVAKGNACEAQEPGWDGGLTRAQVNNLRESAKIARQLYSHPSAPAPRKGKEVRR